MAQRTALTGNWDFYLGAQTLSRGENTVSAVGNSVTDTVTWQY